MKSTLEKIKENYLLIIIIIISIIIVAGTIALGVYTYKKSKANGATYLQQQVGKKIGEFCSSDAMCGTNKCKYNLCVL